MSKEHEVLGLREGATETEIRAAYRRKAHALHPDKFSYLGPEAVARATARFREVVDAYRSLLSSVTHPSTARVSGGVYYPSNRVSTPIYNTDSFTRAVFTAVA